VPTVTSSPPHRAASPGRLRLLYRRFQHLIHELGRFGVVGGTAFVIDTVIFGALLGAGWETVAAKTISTVVSATAAFIGNRFWTWRNRARSAMHREYALYFVFNLIGLGITLAVLGLSHYVLGAIWPVFATPVADLIFGQLLANALATIFRFWTYRRFVFLEPQAETSTAAGWAGDNPPAAARWAGDNPPAAARWAGDNPPAAARWAGDNPPAE
jgi:putative flippase GtrA